ncbi:MAG: cation-transporting P-type ATPase, partial [Solirubrobacteraceae bacterium]|nr:cation-transporting P-type ATPase [Solirubrobacteraceae bacterium]
MRIGRLSPEDAVASLRSSPQGLGSGEAARRLAEVGPNRLGEVPPTPWWRRGVQQLTHFFALVLWL